MRIFKLLANVAAHKQMPGVRGASGVLKSIRHAYQAEGSDFSITGIVATGRRESCWA
jgi:hypothetical protein